MEPWNSIISSSNNSPKSSPSPRIDSSNNSPKNDIISDFLDEKENEVFYIENNIK